MSGRIVRPAHTHTHTHLPQCFSSRWLFCIILFTLWIFSALFFSMNSGSNCLEEDAPRRFLCPTRKYNQESLSAPAALAQPRRETASEEDVCSPGLLSPGIICVPRRGGWRGTTSDCALLLHSVWRRRHRLALRPNEVLLKSHFSFVTSLHASPSSRKVRNSDVVSAS